MQKSTDLPQPPAPKLASQAGFARLMNVSRMAVSKWKAEGKLILSGSLVDVAATRAHLDRYRLGGSEPRKSGDAAPVYTAVNQPALVNLDVNHEPDVNLADEDDEYDVNRGDPDAMAAEILRTTGTDWSLDEAKRVKESFLALRARLRYDLEAGAVVPVAEVVARVTAEYAAVRTRLLAIPAEHAPQIARLRAPAEVRDYLEAVIVEILTALSSADAEA